ncbi:MAG: hypothetical protein MJK12_18135 [Colwellia sp.]|nr:hypothetical protein [Colwellia sp.]
MKNIVDIIKSLVSIMAIIVGGVWTYYIFINDRLDKPHADVNIQLQCHNISEEKRLIYITSTIKNRGNSILKSRESILRLNQIIPLPADIKKKVDAGADIVWKGKLEPEWTKLAERKITWEKNGFLIEPSESDQVQKEFVINRSVEALEVYFYLDNEENRHGGWGLSKFYVFNDPNSSNKAMQLTACSGS